MIATLLHHPRKLWLRRAFFQIHLWLGVLLSLYVIVIGLSGATLVFQDEIRQSSMRRVSFDKDQVAPISTVIATAQQSFPAWRLTFLSPPQPQNPRWTLYFEDARKKDHTIFADAATGAPYQSRRKLFIDYVQDLHVNLLMGETGFFVNCSAGIGLLVLAITGAILWWPGIKLWTRGFFVSLRRGWKRINYDTHNAIGIWTLLIVSWWGITAVYFLFPLNVAAIVNAVSPLIGMKQPQVPEPSASITTAKMEDIIARQREVSPGYLTGIGLPEKHGGNITLYVDRRRPGDFSLRDVDTFDGHTGQVLAVWRYGENKSLGDWFLWLMYPLHFGTLWGLPVKILWCVLGLSLPVLSVTGLLMYWNRYLRTRWRLLF